MKTLIMTAFFLLVAYSGAAQEIIPFPDLSEHQDYSKNGGKSIDERNYAIYTEDYQEALRQLDEQTDRIEAMRSKEKDEIVIQKYNDELEVIRRKKRILLSEADLVEDLQKFY